MAEWVTVLTAVVMIGVASLVHGYGGFGFGIIGMTGFALLDVDLERMSVVVTICAAVMIARLLLVSRREHPVHWLKMGLLFVGVLAGQPVGYWFIRTFSDHPSVRLVFGAVLVAFALYGLRKRTQRRALPLWSATPIGLLSGFTGGAFVSGGPPTILYLYSQVDDPREMKPTVQAIFLAGVTYRLLLIGTTGAGFSGEILLTAALAVPASLVALTIGHRASRRVTVRQFRTGVYGFIAAMGVFIAARAAWLWWTLPDQ